MITTQASVTSAQWQQQQQQQQQTCAALFTHLSDQVRQCVSATRHAKTRCCFNVQLVRYACLVPVQTMRYFPFLWAGTENRAEVMKISDISA